MADNPHIGSDFDDFLQDQGLLEEGSATAMKRVVAWQLAEAMKAQRVTKSALAERMGTSRSQLDRILGGGGMTLETLGRAADALGLRVKLEVQRRPQKTVASRKKTKTHKLRGLVRAAERKARPVRVRKRA